jgi:arylsulfatase A-like enzyme
MSGMKILVVQASSLHLGFIGCYGNDWAATPHLDFLAADGIVFDQHIAEELPPSPVTQAPDTRLQVEELSDRVIKKAVKALVDAGVVWLDGPCLSPPWAVAEEFLQHYFGAEDDAAEPESVPPDEPLEPWLEPPLGPFAEEDRERLRLTYAAVVSAFDSQIGSLLEALQERKLLEETLVCVTASSGLALGEHGTIGAYRPWLHEEIVHVPLILRFPGGLEAGLRVNALTQPADLEPTFRALQGLAAGPAPGHDLTPLIRGETDQVRAFACSRMRLDAEEEWSLRRPDWAFLWPRSIPRDGPPRSAQLYVKPDDRWEVNDVRQHFLELADELEATLRAHAENAGWLAKDGQATP